MEQLLSLHFGSSYDRDSRKGELGIRCLIVRGREPNVKKVVGIAADRPDPGKMTFSEDIVYLDIPEWTEELEKKVEEAQAKYRYFRNLKKSNTQKKQRPKFKMPRGKKKTIISLNLISRAKRKFTFHSEAKQLSVYGSVR
jgi:hypothetical protein